MAFGIVDQWTVSFNGDQLGPDELYEIQVIDQVGLQLPEIRIQVRTPDEEKVRLLTKPGFLIELGIGKTSIEETIKFRAFKKIVDDGVQGENNYFITLWGLMDKMDYLRVQRMESYKSEDDKKPSSDVWTEVCGRNELVPETEESNDKMNWLQYNISDRRFLEEVTWASYFDNDDPVLATIRRDSKAIFKPISKLKTIKGTLGNTLAATYNANSILMNQFDGFLSTWAGLKRNILVQNMEDGTDSETTLEATQQIVGVGFDQVERFQEREMVNENLHENWWQAVTQNRVLRASLSAITIKCRLNVYTPLFPLDYVTVNWQRIRDNQPVQMFGGEWLVAANRISIMDSHYEQIVVLARESLL